MSIQLKEACRWQLLVPTSMGVRLTPASGQAFRQGGMYSLQATSAETNVASVASYLGMKVKVLTAFVKDSPVAAFIRQDLQGRGMDVEGPQVPQGGPWGYRHQINMADGGFGLRGPRVWNDRAGEVGRTLHADDFPLEEIFARDGVQIMHLSGLVAALAPDFCLSLAEVAARCGTRISFDLNYRASFWEGQESRLREVFAAIAERADILIGNEEDFQLCLGVEGPETGGKNLDGAAFRAMIDRIKDRFPKASMVATTLREVLDANRHLWGAIVSSEGQWYEIPPRKIGVLDRIGGGDGFVGGLLYGVLKGWEPEKCAQFGWASGALAASLPTDYAVPDDEQQLWSIWNGNARVKR
jgi:2-dehydro-3-deoxygluconokinase